MNQELRFILAITLMIIVLVVTNVMFPPVPPEGALEGTAADSTAALTVDSLLAAPTVTTQQGPAAPTIPQQETAAAEVPVQDPVEAAIAEREIVVETPLYRLRFSNYGARLTSVELLGFESFARPGAVQLLAKQDGVLGGKIRVDGSDVDLSGLPFEVSTSGFTLAEGSEPRHVTFTYRHPDRPFVYSIDYQIDPSRYLIDVDASVQGVSRALLVADLGPGIAYNETKPSEEARSMGYVVNHPESGIRAVLHAKVDEPALEQGPFLWAALKSKYFLMAVLPGSEGDTNSYIGEVSVEPHSETDLSNVTAVMPFASDGSAHFRLYLGPQEFSRLAGFGDDLENVNPYGWRFFRPIIRPFVGVVMFVLTGLHNGLSLGYGWVLIIFGVAMRVLLFPLNHKAMKAQMRNMAVQPLLQDIQKRYKDQPEKLQKEMMKLYKEHGFNPLAGCLPMLLPWPVLITLFFVFQNTIELRGVPFLWLPSLSGPDPLYILPLLLGVSMFFMQWINIRVTPNPNPQLKMMMWIFPIMFTFIFLNFASGLNLYYVTVNLATLPQQLWLANERSKIQPLQPATSGD